MSMSPADDRLCTVDFLPSSSSTLESNAESNSQHELNLLKAVAYNFANGVLSPPPYASADDPSAVYGCDDNSDFQVTFALVDEDPGFSAPSPSISPSISSNSTYTTVDITSISNFFSPKNNDFPTTRIPTSLNTSRSSNLNFVLFVPSVQNTPLYVVDSRRQKSIKKKRKDTNREFNENDDENLKKSFSLENRGGGVILNLEYYQGEAASSASNNNYNRKISWDFHEIRNLLIDPFIHMIQPACGNVKVDSIISLYGTLHTKADSYSRRQFDPASCNNNNTILPSVFCSSSIRNLHSIPPPATLPRQLHLTAADLYTPISHLISIMRSTLLKLPSPHQQSHSSANYGGTIIFDGIDFSDSVMLEIRPSSTGVAVHEVDHMIREMFSNKWARAVENLEAVVKIATLSPRMKILDHVPAQLSQAYSLLLTVNELVAEDDYNSAMAILNDVLRLSEQLLVDPTMVAPLYFPIEHELAVYLPLWGPLFLPLVMNLLKEWRRIKKMKEKKKKKLV
ncbi:hypothetical protein ScalyP_jg3935 [Parmales sp. scaly parma]|nr:hypothetical protein ScalyP_jg3935 [Parmales sp. scaly parma]